MSIRSARSSSRYLTLGIPGPRGPDAPCGRIEHVALRHINTIEFLKSARKKA